VSLLPTSDRKGYWLIGADASVYPYGDAQYEGEAGGTVRSSPVVAAAATSDDRGYWLVTTIGHVLAFGDAKELRTDLHDLKRARDSDRCHKRRQGLLDRDQHRSGFRLRRRCRIPGSRAGPNWAHRRYGCHQQRPRYWLVAASGKVFCFGNAPDLALSSPKKLASPVVDFAVTHKRTGAWLVEQDGTVLNLGTATSSGR